MIIIILSGALYLAISSTNERLTAFYARHQD